MRYRYASLLWAGLSSTVACGTDSPTATRADTRPVAPAAAPAAAPPSLPDTLAPAATMAAKLKVVTHDYAIWYSYAYYQAPLDQPFAGLSATGRPLPKKDFLRQLATGRYVALRRGRQASHPVYQLYGPVTTPVEAARIREVSRHLAQAELINDAQHSRPLPPFRLTDLAGTTYTPASIRGKVLVIK